MAESDTAQRPEPGPEHRRLEVFVGRWNTEGEIRADPSGPVSRLVAVDTYEWLPGGFFLVHHVEGHMGDEEVRALEIIGWDASAGTYTTRSYDNQGNTAAYRASLQDGAWTITGESERFSGVFSDDRDTLAGSWERLDGTEWLPWMEIRLTRAA